MGAMSAGGHLVVALAADGDTGIDHLWDFVDDAGQRLLERRSTDNGRSLDTVLGTLGVHALPNQDADGHSLPRYCVHPTGGPDVEFRANSLRQALEEAAVWLVRQLGPDDMWDADEGG